MLHRLLRAHPAISGFTNTGAGEDEGQHLQNVYPRTSTYGGPGRFAFDERAHFTESSNIVSPIARATLLKDWSRYWDLSRPVLIEKSPTNLIRARFLQALFPGAKFIFIVRHPIPVSHSTQKFLHNIQKWTGQSESELIRHWLVAHDIFLNDLAYVQCWAWFRYEDLITKPQITLKALFDFLGLPSIFPAEPVMGNIGIRHGSTYEPASSFGQFSDRSPASIMEHFGYQLEWPYLRPAPGDGTVVTSRQ